MHTSRQTIPIISASLIVAFIFTLSKMSSKRKLKTLTLSKKVEVIKAVKSGLKRKKDIATEFGIPTSTLSTILKNADEIIQRSTL